MAHPIGFEPMTFASGVKSHCSAFHGLTLNRPIKAFIIVEIKLAQPAFLYLVCRTGKASASLKLLNSSSDTSRYGFATRFFNTGNY